MAVDVAAVLPLLDAMPSLAAGARRSGAAGAPAAGRAGAAAAGSGGARGAVAAAAAAPAVACAARGAAPRPCIRPQRHAQRRSPAVSGGREGHTTCVWSLVFLRRPLPAVCRSPPRCAPCTRPCTRSTRSRRWQRRSSPLLQQRVGWAECGRPREPSPPSRPADRAAAWPLAALTVARARLAARAGHGGAVRGQRQQTLCGVCACPGYSGGSSRTAER